MNGVSSFLVSVSFSIHFHFALSNNARCKSCIEHLICIAFGDIHAGTVDGTSSAQVDRLQMCTCNLDRATEFPAVLHIVYVVLIPLVDRVFLLNTDMAGK